MCRIAKGNEPEAQRLLVQPLQDLLEEFVARADQPLGALQAGFQQRELIRGAALRGEARAGRLVQQPHLDACHHFLQGDGPDDDPSPGLNHLGLLGGTLIRCLGSRAMTFELRWPLGLWNQRRPGQVSEAIAQYIKKAEAMSVDEYRRACERRLVCRHRTRVRGRTADRPRHGLDQQASGPAARRAVLRGQAIRPGDGTGPGGARGIHPGEDHQHRDITWRRGVWGRDPVRVIADRTTAGP
jgi:hypothetical protein